LSSFSPGDRTTAAQKRCIHEATDWLKTSGEAYQYSKLAASTNSTPVEAYAQAYNYSTQAHSIFTEAELKANPDLQKRVEYADKLVSSLSQNSLLQIDLNKLRSENGGQLTHEAIARAAAKQLGFTDDDMKAYASACGMSDVNSAIISPTDKSQSESDWL